MLPNLVTQMMGPNDQSVFFIFCCNSHIVIFQVKRAVQQLGFVRSKRGFRQLSGVPLSDLKLSNPELVDLLSDEKDVNVQLMKDPTDPLFDKEWFLVSLFE